MYNLSLAKILKEAGYPQGKSLWVYRTDTNDLVPRAYQAMSRDTDIDMPNLSELLEACGDGFLRLTHHIDLRTPYWRVNGYGSDKDYIGPTPEMAVINLWLALNKK